MRIKGGCKMGSIEQLVSKFKIPKMVKIKQKFKSEVISDIPKAIRKEIIREEIIGRIKKGDRIALTVGSRGIANMPIIISEIVSIIKEKGAYPFIVPAMGSHGGATAEGQVEILKDLGITEKTTGAPIRSTMEVVQVGVSKNGLPVCIDKYAYNEADAIVVIGRIKLHTSFRGAYESGLAKMIVIGLGKQIGAEICHSLGIEYMAPRIEEIARVALETVNIIFGVGIIENAYDETYKIVAVPSERIMKDEPKLLLEAKENMPRIMLDKCDVLVVDEMGKNIAGTGMDPNIIRRNCVGTVKYNTLAQRVIILDLTKESHGNAAGMGNADICTKRFFNKIEFDSTNANPLTNRLTQIAKIPMVMENDRQAIQAGIKTCFNVDYENVKLIRIKNTLKLSEIYISENMLEEAKATPGIEVIGEPEYMKFDQNGNL
ncbi:MAG: hypothetical protein K0R31_46 [Clostridiales bacterium]|jgi:hypothetical protein|nr:hypothetical protein [Clostridiales bacterium]